MSKKTRFSLILIYSIAIFLLFIPFLKQALLVFVTENIVIQSKNTSVTSESYPLEAIQTPGFIEVLNLKKKQKFQSVGHLVIPSVEISLPILSGLDNQQLLVGVGNLFPKRKIEGHNLVIIGHHLGRKNLLFGKLLNVSIGDEIYLEYEDSFYSYSVNQTMIIQETELYELIDKNLSEITLITCDKPRQTDQRFVVKGQLRSSSTPKVREKASHLRQTIQKTNNRKDRFYYLIILCLLFLCLLFGISLIYKTNI